MWFNYCNIMDSGIWKGDFEEIKLNVRNGLARRGSTPISPLFGAPGHGISQFAFFFSLSDKIDLSLAYIQNEVIVVTLRFLKENTIKPL